MRAGAQWAPKAHTLCAAPGPPSSHSPSLAYSGPAPRQVLGQPLVGGCGGGGSGAGRGGDNEVRTEINLELGAARSQADAVKAWMGVIGALPGYGIVKQIRVFDFPDCEVVYYEANHKALRVCCVEFEAKYAASEEEGLATLQRYEQQFGFVAERREKVNLFDLLVTAQS